MPTFRARLEMMVTAIVCILGFSDLHSHLITSLAASNLKSRFFSHRYIKFIKL